MDEEYTIAFVVNEVTDKTHYNEHDDSFFKTKNEKTFLYTDFDSAVEQMCQMMSDEAFEAVSRFNEGAPYYFGNNEYSCDIEFEGCSTHEEREKFRAAYLKQLLIGCEDEPDIIKLWKGHSEMSYVGYYDEEKDEVVYFEQPRPRKDIVWDDFDARFETTVSLEEFTAALSKIDVETNYGDRVKARATETVNKLLGTDWSVTASRKSREYILVDYEHPMHGSEKKIQTMTALRSINKTTWDWRMRVSDIEQERHYHSEEGKREREEDAERHRDMMTYMGESGLTSYSVDDDGTYKMWR
tara:strand:- start:4212 stop:5105 length:894 start_codon:yes stop_codon:yes gene_type:complete